MRCYACNCNLNDYESTLKSVESGNYLDMCLSCLKDSGIQCKGNENFNPFEEIDDEFSERSNEEY